MLKLCLADSLTCFLLLHFFFLSFLSSSPSFFFLLPSSLLFFLHYRAIPPAHGAEGLSQDTPLASLWAGLRTLRFADGPDEVHIQQIGKAEVKREALIRAASERIESRRNLLEAGAKAKL